MNVNRRRLLKSLALAGAGAGGADAAITVDSLRCVSEAHGTNLSDDRIRVLAPVLEHKAPQQRSIREFEVDDTVSPAQGILDYGRS